MEGKRDLKKFMFTAVNCQKPKILEIGSAFFGMKTGSVIFSDSFI